MKDKFLSHVYDFQKLIKKEENVDCYRVHHAPYNLILHPPRDKKIAFVRIGSTDGEKFYPSNNKKKIQSFMEIAFKYDVTCLLAVRFGGTKVRHPESKKPAPVTWTVARVTAVSAPETIHRVISNKITYM